MTFYDDYKPFRNYMRRFDLVPSLVDLWCYSLHIIEDRPLQGGCAAGLSPLTMGSLKKHIHPWDIDLLAREILLNAGDQATYSLRRWKDIAAAINHLRRLDGAAYHQYTNPQSAVLFELHRIAHRQFPWQMSMGVNPMMRIFKIFGELAVAKIVERELGMTTTQFLQLGMAVTGHFMREWGMSTNQNYDVLGITSDASKAFFRRITSPLNDLKAEIAKRQSYDQDCMYVWNPLEATPLISFNPSCPERVLCPIPRYLLRRASAGLFYDLVKSDDFDNPFGSSFQAYVGELIKAFCAPPDFVISGEKSYYVGVNKMHGVDWILSDNTGHIFIESKTKRLTVNAKTLAEPTALDKDLAVMAAAIVQHYRNIRDALDEKTDWRPDRLPIYPIVLTLEDWLIFSPRVNEMLQNHVDRMLVDANISRQFLDDMPYTIASAHEFELAIQVISRLNIFPVMSKKTAVDRRIWSLLPFIQTEFREQVKGVNRFLFTDDWEKLMPQVPGGVTFASLRDKQT